MGSGAVFGRLIAPRVAPAAWQCFRCWNGWGPWSRRAACHEISGVIGLGGRRLLLFAQCGLFWSLIVVGPLVQQRVVTYGRLLVGEPVAVVDFPHGDLVGSLERWWGVSAGSSCWLPFDLRVQSNYAERS